MSKVIDEVARHLTSLRLATERGAAAGGDLVQVRVTPHWRPAEHTFDLSVLCWAPAHDAPGWEGLPLWLLPVSAPAGQTLVRSTGIGAPGAPGAAASARQPQAQAVRAQQRAPAPSVTRLARLDRRGHAVLRSVPAGDYRFVAGASWIDLRAPFVPPIRTTSADGRLAATLASPGDGTISLELVGPPGTSAAFAFAAADGTLLAGGEVVLRPGVTDATEARGAWSDAVDLDAVAAFVCQLVRDDDRPNAWI